MDFGINVFHEILLINFVKNKLMQKQNFDLSIGGLVITKMQKNFDLLTD